MAILVTGSAGFVGFHLSKRLLSLGHQVVGVDNLNDYYDVSLKESRNNILLENNNYFFHKVDVAAYGDMEKLFRKHQIEIVIHLAAQAGVRYSIENPFAYFKSNLDGFGAILELSRQYKPKHLIYASSSSVYGMNQKVPFSESDNVDHPVSLYAATKKSNELMAHSYSDLYGLPTTGLRFFTVYGTYGRPDMAYFKFAQAIMEGRPIDVYNNGKMLRDFTFIDDIVDGIVPLIDTIPQKDPDWDGLHPSPAESRAPYRVFNIGNNKPAKLLDFIATLEKHLGKVAEKNYLPMQLGDVTQTFADIDALHKAVGYSPKVDIDAGLKIFADWFLTYYSY